MTRIIIRLSAVLAVLIACRAHAADLWVIHVLQPYVLDVPVSSNPMQPVDVPLGGNVVERFEILSVAPPLSVDAINLPPGVSVRAVGTNVFEVSGAPQVNYHFPTLIPRAEGYFTLKGPATGGMTVSVVFNLPSPSARCGSPVSWISDSDTTDRSLGVWLPSGSSSVLVTYEHPNIGLPGSWTGGGNTEVFNRAQRVSFTPGVLVDRYTVLQPGARRFAWFEAGAPTGTRITVEIECPIVVSSEPTVRELQPLVVAAPATANGRHP